MEAAAALTAADDAATAADEATTTQPAGWPAWKAVPGSAAGAAAKEDAAAGAVDGAGGCGGAGGGAGGRPPAEGAWAAGGVSAPRALSTASEPVAAQRVGERVVGELRRRADGGGRGRRAGGPSRAAPCRRRRVGAERRRRGIRRRVGQAGGAPAVRRRGVRGGRRRPPGRQPSTSTVAGVSICPPSSASPVPSMGACSKPKTSCGVSRLSRNSSARPTLAGLPDLSQAAHGLRRPNRPRTRSTMHRLRQPGVPGPAAQGGQDAGDGGEAGCGFMAVAFRAGGECAASDAAGPRPGAGAATRFRECVFRRSTAPLYIKSPARPQFGAEKNHFFFKIFQNSCPVTARDFD